MDFICRFHSLLKSFPVIHLGEGHSPIPRCRPLRLHKTRVERPEIVDLANQLRIMKSGHHTLDAPLTDLCRRGSSVVEAEESFAGIEPEHQKSYDCFISRTGIVS